MRCISPCRIDRWLLLALAAGGLLAAVPAVRGADERLQPIVDDPKLPRVLLIGDSISMGYTIPVRKILAGKANVHRIPDNAGTTKKVLEHLEAWLGDGKWDVIHFNIGLHDLKQVEGNHQVLPDKYEANLRTIVARLQKTGALLVWATTTPVPEGAANRKPGDEILYNEAAARVMADAGVESVDLYALAKENLPSWQQRADVHFNTAGYRGLAKAVASAIRKRLPHEPAESASPK